jgi:hypothetical protein
MEAMSDNALLSIRALRPGTPVEVRSSFDRNWKRGFQVESVDGCGYRLRRNSDGSVLPTVFAFDVVRQDSWDGVDRW